MKQLFPKAANAIARYSIIGGIFTIGFLGWAISEFNNSSYVTLVGTSIDQPVPFSHKHHVGGLGMDCRFCHTSVEKSSFAGIPATETCMKCHSVLFTDSEILEPVRESYKTGKPLEWNRVHDLPDHVYFDHSIHIAKGVSCQECHGDVDQMALMAKAGTLRMNWCLDCHRHPETALRPKEEVFNMDWEEPKDIKNLRKTLKEKYKVETVQDCSACHR